MKTRLFILYFLPIVSCGQPIKTNIVPNSQKDTLEKKYPAIGSIPVPDGYKRLETIPGSFTAYLRELKLKKDKTVYLYNGQPKINQSAQFAVLDLPTGKEDLQQCADGVMRIRATYLFMNKRYDEITFKDNNDRRYQFTEPFTKDHFEKYLKQVYSNCGTASLSKQLKRIPIKEMQPGDVLIKGGFPGHAVIVTDMAINTEGEKIFMLAQSYMPAQDIHLLRNPLLKNDTPWYFLNLVFPE